MNFSEMIDVITRIAVVAGHEVKVLRYGNDIFFARRRNWRFPETGSTATGLKNNILRQRAWQEYIVR